MSDKTDGFEVKNVQDVTKYQYLNVCYFLEALKHSTDVSVAANNIELKQKNFAVWSHAETHFSPGII